MNNWLEAERAGFQKQADEKRTHQDRLQLIQQHTGRVFEQLKGLIRDAVEKINADEEFTMRTGGLEGQFMYTDKVIVRKSTYPAILTTVTRAPNTIDLHRNVITNGANHQSWEERESLEVDLDDSGNPFLRAKEGKPLLPEEAVRYIFYPILHPESIERKQGANGGSWGVSSW